MALGVPLSLHSSSHGMAVQDTEKGYGRAVREEVLTPLLGGLSQTVQLARFAGSGVANVPGTDAGFFGQPDIDRGSRGTSYGRHM